MAQNSKAAVTKAPAAGQPVSDPAVVDLQRELKQQGYYAGELDGRMGKDTQDAVKRRDESLASKNAVKVSENTRAAKEAENDPTARLTKMATEIAPWATGAGIGSAVGHYGFGKPYAAADSAAKDQVSRLAKAMQIDPVAKEAQVDKMAKGRTMRNAAQFAAPAALIGAGYATRNYLAPMFSDPQMQDIIKSVGTGENAAGMTLGVHQLVDLLRRGNPVDPVDEAQIRSEAARSRMTPDQLDRSTRAPVAAPEPTPQVPAASQAPAPAAEPVTQTLRNSDRLRQAVRATGGATVPNKAAAAEHLLAAVNNGNRSAVAKALGVSSGPNLDKRVKAAITALATKPGASALAAATIAAGMTMGGEAEAADGSSRSFGDQAADAAKTGAVAGGAAYGAAKVAPSAMASLLRSFGKAGTALAPFTGADLSDEYAMDDQQKARDRNWVARNIPGAGYVPGPIGEAYEMAQVPERAPASPPAQSAPGSEFDQLVAASADDPELASLLQQAIMSRLSAGQ